MTLSLIGIFVGLILLMYMCFKGNSIVWVAPFCATIVAIFALGAGLGETAAGAPRTLLTAYTVDYMNGLAGYVISWFPAFLLGAVYGKVMDMTGAARSLANAIVKLIGPKLAVLAVVLPCMLLTYGGISLFVVVFVIYPMGYAIYQVADLPRTLLPGAIAFGAFGITMTCVPGTPQIQNLIPMQFYNTTPTAALGLSFVCVVVIGIPGYLFLEYQVRKARKNGEHFIPDPKHVEPVASDQPGWHWLTGLVPILAVFVCLNILEWSIVVSLLVAIIAVCLLNINQWKILLPAISQGANGSLTAIMNTSCAVGFGSVVKIVPGFAVLTNAMLNMGGGNILFSEAVAVNVLAGATGSASGGMSIALTALGPKYMELAANAGISPEWLHRIASISSGGLDTLPHNGAVLTLLAVSNCTHKEGYWGVCVTTCLIPTLMSFVIALVLGFFI